MLPIDALKRGSSTKGLINAFVFKIVTVINSVVAGLHPT
jgi:hypothetical protein